MYNCRDFSQTGVLLGAGISRTVFVLNTTQVIKFGSEEVNQREVTRWESVRGTSAEKYFFPVLSHAEDYSWIIMERAVDTVNNALKMSRASKDYQQKYDKVYNFGAEVNKLGVVSVHDNHSGNIGVRSDGTWAFLDYAY